MIKTIVNVFSFGIYPDLGYFRINFWLKVK